MDTTHEGERKGWVKLFRKFQDNGFFRDSYMVHLINYLLLKANYEDKTTIFNGSPLTAKRGQLIFGLNAAYRDTGISIKRLRRRMQTLETEGFIERERPNSRCNSGEFSVKKWAGKYSLVTICNYEHYQGSQNDEGQSEGQGEGKDRATSKEVKEVKKNIGRSKKQTDPRVKEFFDFWGQTFLQETGEPYTFTGGKEGSLIKDLLKNHDLNKLQDLTLQFFKDEQCKRRGLTIGIFRQEINRLIGIKAMDPLEQLRRERRQREARTREAG